jgi:hypothetical protein
MKKRIFICALIITVSLAFFVKAEQRQHIKPFLELDRWLSSHPRVRDAMISPTSGRYDNWPFQKKIELSEIFSSIRDKRSLNICDPLPNIHSLEDDKDFTTVLSEDHAWLIYLAYIAHSLVVEIDNWTPWSVDSYDNDSLAILFDGRRWLQSSHGGIELVDDMRRIVPAPPDYVFNFLTNNNLIAENQLQTIGRVLEWCGQNMFHYYGPYILEDHWHYRGAPPLSRVIEGTPHIKYPEDGIHHFTAGCWGTSCFLHTVLRVINIPATYVRGGNHALPYFPSENLYLSHGDDPYFGLSRLQWAPEFQILDLLIDHSKYEEWFGNHVPFEEQNRNVGRRPKELLIEYLPNNLLRDHKRDLRYGSSYEDSAVYGNFKGIYTVAELERIGLWTRIEEKIAKLGGIGKIPKSIEGTVCVNTIYKGIKTKIGLNGVVLEGLPHFCETYARGRYDTEVPGGWGGVIKPVRSGNIFTPVQLVLDKAFFTNSFWQDFTDSTTSYALLLASNPEGKVEPSPGIYFHGAGAKVYLRAFPNENYRFLKWSGDITSTSSIFAITMNSDISVKANFLRIIHPPSNFAGEKVENRSLSQAEYINVLTWDPNPNNENIIKYRIYQIEGENRNLVIELDAGTFQYWHLRVEKEKPYIYAIYAVNYEGKEGQPTHIFVQ